MSDEAATSEQPDENRLVYIRDPNDGSIKQGPLKDLGKALEAGASIVSDEEGHRAEAQKQYGGVGDQAAAFGINAADALTLGFGKGAAVDALGDDAATYIRGVDEANPLAAGLGTVAGALAPAVFSGGESLAARTVAAPTEALEGLGSMAGRGVESSLAGLGDGLGAKVARAGLSSAADMGVQGAVYGAGSAYSESQLLDHPLTAEQYLAAMGKGALFGAALGGTLGAGGKLLGEGVGAGLARVSDRFGQEGSSISEALEHQAQERAFKSTKATPTQVARLEKSGLSQAEVGQYMLERLPEYSEGKPFWKMSRHDIADAAKAAMKDEGAKVGDAVAEIDRIAGEKGARPNFAQIDERIQREVIDPLSNDPFTKDIAAKIRAHADKLAETAGVLERDESGQLVRTGSTGEVSFSQLNDWRKSLDELVYKQGKIMTDTPIANELRSMRKVMEDEFTKQAEAIAPEAVGGYKAAKENFRRAASIDSAIAPAIKRGVGNRTVGLTDYLAGGIGHAIGGIPGAVAASGVNKVVREFGDQALASAMHHASSLSFVGDVATRFDNRLTEGVSKLLTTGGTRAAEGAVKVKQGSGLRSAESRANIIRDLGSAPMKVAEIAARVGPPAAAMPTAAATFAKTQLNALTYLNRQLPQGAPVSPLMPAIKQPPSDADMRAWERKLDVYEDPSVVLDEMDKGTLTQDHVDALRAIYPAIYQDLQGKVMTQLAELGAKDKLPPFDTRMQLGILFSIPADATMDPAFVAAQQAAFGAAPDPAPHPPAQAATAKLSQAGDMTTESEGVAKADDLR